MNHQNIINSFDDNPGAGEEVAEGPPAAPGFLLLQHCQRCRRYRVGNESSEPDKDQGGASSRMELNSLKASQSSSSAPAQQGFKLKIYLFFDSKLFYREVFGLCYLKKSKSVKIHSIRNVPKYVTFFLGGG
jgi:hypothetical protein